MATDDERRRVAAALRRAEVYTLQGRRNDGLVLEWHVALMSELAEAVGVVDDKSAAALGRLADLIEPSCDRDALLALAGELERRADSIIKAARDRQFTGCGPTMCEAKHDACEWRWIARLIRKACGVTP